MLTQLGFIFSSSDAAADGSGFGWEQVIAFGVVIAIMAMMPRIIKKIRRERKALTRQETESIRNRPNIRGKADEILVELAEMSREINAQVDTKIRVLNKLIRDAEKVVKKYEQLQQNEHTARHSAYQQPVSPGNTVTENTNTDSRGTGVKTDSADKAEIMISSDVKSAEVDTAANHDGSKSLAGSEATGVSETGVWQRSIATKILELNTKGYDVNEIARKVRMSVSEVALILEIHKNELDNQ